MDTTCSKRTVDDFDVYCQPLSGIQNRHTKFEEQLWIEINTISSHDILIGTIYRSLSSLENDNTLCDLLRVVTNIKHDHLIITGDFNLKQINWANKEVNGENSSYQFKVFDTINDIFLSENVKQATRFKGSDKPSYLDWVLSENATCVSELNIDAPLEHDKRIGGNRLGN